MGDVVTVLFTDLVGSTELTRRLGDERHSVVIQEHFRVLRDAALRRAGTVVKGTGDGLMVVFSSAGEAAACAVDMQRAVRASGSDGVTLSMRVGLHVGEPERSDDDYFGTPVNIASRLCDAAEPGQILASEVVRAIAGSKPGLTFTSVGALSLKGIEEPVPAYEIAWEATGGPVPLPPFVARDTTALIGRDGELEQLRAALERAGEGRRAFLVVAGEPGIGKTRLVFQIAREAHASGSTVLYGRCHEEPVMPYQHFVEALDHLTEHRPDDVRVAAPELARLIPGIQVGPVASTGDPEVDRYRLFEGVATLLARQADGAPLVLILDDLHWADRPTLTLLRHLVTGASQSRMLVIGTYRDIELDRRHPLAGVLAELRREGLVERIRLRGLSEMDLERLFADLAGHEIDDPGRELARALHRETEGNPFFVREILRHLVETGAIYMQDGRWTSDRAPEEVGLPESVREVIGRRLDRLGEDCGDVLAVAAVLGREFDLPLLSRLTEHDEDRLADLLDEAVGVGGVVQEMPGRLGWYLFAHALVREALYHELSTNRRVRLHRRAGEALEDLHRADVEPYLGELAHHFHEAAAAGATDKAIHYARRAGARALENLAFEDAPGYLERALQALELDGAADAALRCELLLELGEAYRLVADTESCRRTCMAAAEIARREGWPELLARAALTYGGLWIDIGLVRQELVEILRDAATALPEDHPTVPLLYGRLSMELFSAPGSEEREVYSRRAVEAARRVGEPRTLAYALIARRQAVSGPARLDERLSVTGEAISLARSIGEIEVELRARAFRIGEHMETADLAGAEADYAEFFRLAAESKQPMYSYVSDLFRTGIALREGRLDEVRAAEPYLAEWARRQGRVTAVVATAVQRALRSHLSGTSDHLDAEAVDVLRAFAASDPVHALKRVWLDLLLGRVDECRAGFQRFLDAPFLRPPDDWDYLPALNIVALLCESLHEPGPADVLDGYARPFEDRVVCLAGTAFVAVMGTVADILGICCELTGNLDEAAARYEHAVEICRAIRARPLRVQSTVRLARTLSARDASGDRDRARTLLEEALRESAEMGLGAPFVEEARRLLSDAVR